MIKKGALLFLLFICCLVVILDQIFFFKFYEPQTHFLFSAKEDPIFRNDPGYVGALIRPDAKENLARLMKRSERKIHWHSDYVLDENGMRQSGEIKNLNRPVTINVFGDSFTFGLFLKENQTFIHYLNQESNRCKFMNYGVPAFSLLEMINLSLDPNITKPADHHLFIFITDDIYRIFTKQEVHRFGRKVDVANLKEEIWPELESPLTWIGMPEFLVKNSFVLRTLHNRLVEQVGNQLDLEKLFIGLQAYLKRSTKQKSFSFIHLPEKEMYTAAPELPQTIMEISLLLGKDQKAANDLLNYFFVEDNHPNAEGARWIADEIKIRLQEMCF